MQNDFKTVNEESIGKIEIDKSKFICYLSHIENEEEAKEYINSIRKQHLKATHHCYAYIYNNGTYYKSNDDGEPGGSAGMPMLNVLKTNNFNNVVAVVVRYFGGILLGKGGLVRAYTNAVIEGINQAKIINQGYRPTYKIVVDISLYNVVDQILKNPGIKILNRDFDSDVTITVMLINDYDINTIVDLTNGKAKIIDTGLLIYTY